MNDGLPAQETRRAFYVWKQRDPLTGITSVAPMWWFGHWRILWHRLRFWTWELRGY